MQTLTVRDGINYSGLRHAMRNMFGTVRVVTNSGKDLGIYEKTDWRTQVQRPFVEWLRMTPEAQRRAVAHREQKINRALAKQIANEKWPVIRRQCAR